MVKVPDVLYSSDENKLNIIATNGNFQMLLENNARVCGCLELTNFLLAQPHLKAVEKGLIMTAPSLRAKCNSPGESKFGSKKSYSDLTSQKNQISPFAISKK